MLFPDLPVEGSPFTLVNSEGKVIPGDLQLGIVLYKRGGTLCLDNWYLNRSNVADAICKEMNYKSGIQMMNEGGSNDIFRWWEEQNLNRYSPELYDVKCFAPNWEDCTWKKPNFVEREGCWPMNFNYLMIRCSGKKLLVHVLVHLFALFKKPLFTPTDSPNRFPYKFAQLLPLLF